jgi:hyperosmotically inducible protein
MKMSLFRVLIVAACVIGSTASFAQETDASQPKASKKASPADRALEKSVRRALSKAQGFDSSGVFVRARGGAVTLSGSVRSGDQIERAAEIARSVEGVSSVSNKLALFHGGNG